LAKRPYDKWFGKNDAPLVWKAATRTMNQTVPQSFIDEEIRKDPANALSEYGAEFRTDIEAFISMDVLRSCVQSGVYERPPELRWRYYCFTDPSGGSSDSFTLAIAHKEGNTVVLDLIREVRPPFSPEQVVEEFAAVVKKYRITKVVGDRYGGEWPRERFRICGLNYELVDLTKSEIYQALLPIINSNQAIMLDHDRMVLSVLFLGTSHGSRWKRFDRSSAPNARRHQRRLCRCDCPCEYSSFGLEQENHSLHAFQRRSTANNAL